MTLIRQVVNLTWKHIATPRLLKPCINSFSLWNSHWDLRFYTDMDCEEFVRNRCPEWADIYFAYPPGIYRADIFRLLVLLHEGGVYADIDVECRRPLDDLIAHHGQGDDWEVLLATDHPVHEICIHSITSQ